MTSSSYANEAEPKKKKSFFSFSAKKKSSKQKKNEPVKKDGTNVSQNRVSPSTQRNKATAELVDRAKFDDQDYSSSRLASTRNLIAMAYQSTTSESFRASPESAMNRFSDRSIVEKGVTKSTDSLATKSGQSGGMFPSASFTRSSYFQKMCDDVFDSIDSDRSGKINEDELYQGLLLLHLKLGLYFGPAACKPISLDRTKFIFGKLDTNRDGSLDKSEFRSVLALLIGNVMSRIVFQFICTLLIVPFVASTLLEKIHGIKTELWPSIIQKYRPLIEMAFGWDLITMFASMIYTTIRDSRIGNYFFGFLEAQLQAVAQKFDSSVLQPIGNIPQETWDSLPLTFLSTVLTLIIVPYSITKTDDFFRYLANYFGGKKFSK